MKKMVIMILILICALFLGGCTAGKKNDTIANPADALEPQSGSKIEQLNDMRRNTEPGAQNNQVTGSGLEGQNDRMNESSFETQVLQLGGMGNLGMGFLVCAVPDKEDEDYKLCFFGTESESEDTYKSFSEIEFDLEEADYVFPDVREDNMSIGRFLDIYYFDMTEIRDTESAFIVIARYDVNGKTCYDTRVYMQRGKDYCVDEEWTRELNGKYRDVEEYPITELFMLPQELEDSGVPDAEEIKDSGYSILTYTKAPNENSMVRIQYPFLEGEGKETLNNLIYGKVQELAQIDDTLFPVDSALTVDYQAEITLQNAKIVSIVFWGTSSVGQSAYATNDVIPLNIDMRTVKEISFEELYVANEDFQKIFFEKAYLPTAPVTSCYEMSFAEMLALQSPEYQPVSPFSISGNVRCFLKQNALVLSMPSVHASGSDHFEAQIDYDDLEDFYLPEQEYWK